MPIVNVPKSCASGIGGARARCHKMAVGNSEYCSDHTDVKTRIEAPAPDVVLVWFKLSDTWAVRFSNFLRLNVRMDRKQHKFDRMHVAQAKALGRDPRALRKGIVDSGSPIFGVQGATGHRIWSANVITDLLQQGYGISTVEVCKKPIPNRAPENRLKLEFRRGESFIDAESLEKFCSLYEEFGAAVFNQVLVWSNPANEKNEVVHTVNFKSRESGPNPDCVLRFLGSDWVLAAVPPAVPDPPAL